MTGIYKITNPKGRIYIGQSNDLARRKSIYNEPLGARFQVRLKNSIQKYGWENHVFEIIEECSEEDLNLRERYWQEFYNVLSKNGLNCKLTSINGKSGKLSEFTKDNIRKALKGTTKTCKSSMKSVYQYDKNGILICEFSSLREASRVLKLDIGSLSRCCNGGVNKTVGGFIFKYK